MTESSITKRVDMSLEQYTAAEKALETHPTWAVNMQAAQTPREREALVFALVVREGLKALEGRP